MYMVLLWNSFQRGHATREILVKMIPTQGLNNIQLIQSDWKENENQKCEHQVCEGKEFADQELMLLELLLMGSYVFEHFIFLNCNDTNMH